MEINVSQSISSIPAKEWNALVSENNFYNSHEWLYSMERTSGPTKIFSVRHSDQLILGCPVWNNEAEPDLFSAQSLFKSIQGPWQDKFLWMGGPRSTHNELIYNPDKISSSTLDAFFKNALEYASKSKKTGFVIPYMTLSKAIGYLKNIEDIHFILHDAEAFYDVPPTGLEGLLSRLNKHRRVSIKSEIKKFSASGSCIQWSSLTEDTENEIIRLITSNRSKYGSTDEIAWMKKIFAGQKEAGIFDHAVVAFSTQNDNITAVTIFYPWRKTLYSRYFGCDYSYTENDFRYFVLSYYSAIDYAAQHGFYQIAFSISALDAKTKRGCRIEPLVALVGLKNGMISKNEIRKNNQDNLKKYESRFKKNLGRNWDLLRKII